MKELSKRAVKSSEGKICIIPDRKIIYKGGIQRVCVSIPGMSPVRTEVRIVPFAISSQEGLKNKTSSGQVVGI